MVARCFLFVLYFYLEFFFFYIFRVDQFESLITVPVVILSGVSAAPIITLLRVKLLKKWRWRSSVFLLKPILTYSDFPVKNPFEKTSINL